MFIKTYKYHLAPGRMEEFMEMQKEANALYREVIECKIELLESDRTPGEIVEIQYLADRETYEKARKALDADPRVIALSKRFEALLDPAAPSLNPFLHDRQKTYQPRDLWESLLKFAIILFTLDVAVRRIQIGRDEWLRAAQVLRRWIFFWRGAPRPAEAEESLAALLARRDAVRSRQTAPALEPRPDLFRPDRPATLPLPGSEATTTPTLQAEAPANEPAEPVVEAPAATTTRRLLEAKRRAQMRRGK